MKSSDVIKAGTLLVTDKALVEMCYGQDSGIDFEHQYRGAVIQVMNDRCLDWAKTSGARGHGDPQSTYVGANTVDIALRRIGAEEKSLETCYKAMVFLDNEKMEASLAQKIIAEVLRDSMGAVELTRGLVNFSQQSVRLSHYEIMQE